MLVGDPSYAAQLQTTDGAVLHFDDPGCLLLYQREVEPEVHAVWLHHVHEDRWLARERARFVLSGPSPMGYGLGAVDEGATDTLRWEEALEQARSRDAARLRRTQR
jgi:hypothetical protein